MLAVPFVNDRNVGGRLQTARNINKVRVQVLLQLLHHTQLSVHTCAGSLLGGAGNSVEHAVLWLWP